MMAGEIWRAWVRVGGKDLRELWAMREIKTELTVAQNTWLVPAIFFFLVLSQRTVCIQQLLLYEFRPEEECPGRQDHHAEEWKPEHKVA